MYVMLILVVVKEALTARFSFVEPSLLSHKTLPLPADRHRQRSKVHPTAANRNTMHSCYLARFVAIH